MEFPPSHSLLERLLVGGALGVTLVSFGVMLSYAPAFRSSDTYQREIAEQKMRTSACVGMGAFGFMAGVIVVPAVYRRYRKD